MTQDDYFFVNRSNQQNWYDDLCDYYSVTPEKALELGTRKPNRKPDLPGSNTTHPVSNMTFEDIWSLAPRTNEESIYKFYKDQGAWSSFRQVVRHKDMQQYHLQLMSAVLSEGSTHCEYGCGIAPFTYSLLTHVNPTTKMTIYLSDVDCEHLTFGCWRINRLIERRNLKDITIEKIVIEPNKLPKYPKKIDSLLSFEVFEHVPSPLKVIGNIFEQMQDKALLCENFIKHEVDEGPDGPDLKSAAYERNAYYEFLTSNFNLVNGRNFQIAPNETRIWEKK